MAKGKQACATVLSKKGRLEWRVFGCNVIPLVMLQAYPVPESRYRRTVAVMPSDANLFNLLKGNHIIKIINVISFL
jgi:hypothetical protein